jgi:hypothetical protein
MLKGPTFLPQSSNKTKDQINAVRAFHSSIDLFIPYLTEKLILTKSASTTASTSAVFTSKTTDDKTPATYSSTSQSTEQQIQHQNTSKADGKKRLISTNDDEDGTTDDECSNPTKAKKQKK